MIIADICFDHIGRIERKAVELDNVRSFTSHKHRTTIITFGRDNKGIYCSLQYHSFVPCRFYKIEDMRVQINDSIYALLEQALLVYKGDLRDAKIIEIGII